jgi:hypothetical protein
MHLADSMWGLMKEKKYYSVADLATLTGQPRSTVFDVVKFLTEYGFIKCVGVNDPVFIRSTVFSPRESIKLLECVAEG